MSWMVYWNSKTQQKYTCWTTKPINALHSAPISGFYCQNGSIDTTDLTQMTSSLGHQIVQLWTTSLLKWSLFFNAVNEDISKSCIRALNHWCKIKIKNSNRHPLSEKIGLISSLIFIGIKQNQKSSNAQHITMMNRNKYAQVQNLLKFCW